MGPARRSLTFASLAEVMPDVDRLLMTPIAVGGGIRVRAEAGATAIVPTCLGFKHADSDCNQMETLQPNEARCNLTT
jgi:hypothetical protein